MAGEPVDVRVLRPEDLLVLDITLTNLAIGDDGALHVVDRAVPGRRRTTSATPSTDG